MLKVESIELIDLEEDVLVYDIEVPEDHSFQIGGIVLHNSKYCASRDGLRYKTNEPYPRPPYHRNCRTVLAPVLDDSLIGNRPAKGSDGTTQVNANTNFASWFKNQSENFKREWLGNSRYKLYMTNKYPLDRFVDPLGKQYSLRELEVMDQRTFAEVFG